MGPVGKPAPGSSSSRRCARLWLSRALLRLAVASLCLSVGCIGGLPGAKPAERTYRIGYLTSSAPDAPAAVDGYQQFLQRLEELGYRDGENIAIEYRHTGGREDLFPSLAEELVGLPVDIIVVADSRAIPIAKQATATIPIVMTISGDVVSQGLVASLAQPGGNITGLTDLSVTLAGKRLELLRDAVPDASGVAVLWNKTLPGLALSWGTLQATALALGVDLVSLEVTSLADIDYAFEAANWKPLHGLLVLPDPLTNTNARRIVELSAERQVPAMYGTKVFVDIGGLMYYGPSRAALFRRAADYVDKILNGADPATTPIEQPSVFDFVINLTTAQMLGLSIPTPVLRQATEVRQ